MYDDIKVSCNFTMTDESLQQIYTIASRHRLANHCVPVNVFLHILHNTKICYSEISASTPEHGMKKYLSVISSYCFCVCFFFFVLAAFMCMFCIFMTHSTSYCFKYKFMDP